MENLMSMFNPETMQNLMENEDIKKMMSDPNMMNNLQNMMGNMGGNDLFKGLNTECDSNDSSKQSSCKQSSCECDPCECDSENYGINGSECDEITIDNLENIEIGESRLNIGDKIVTKDLKNETYNNKRGIIEDLLPNGRFVITINDKTIAIKEENLENIYENIENID
jgi:hypothetical protein